MNMEKQLPSYSRKGAKYAKIPLLTKIRLFKTVIEDGSSIKRTARLLAIKYSTAKTLVRKFKDEQGELDLQAYEHETVEHNLSTKEEKRCSYSLISDLSPSLEVKEENIDIQPAVGCLAGNDSRKVDERHDKKSYRKIEIISNIIKSS